MKRILLPLLMAAALSPAFGAEPKPRERTLEVELEGVKGSKAYEIEILEQQLDRNWKNPRQLKIDSTLLKTTLLPGRYRIKARPIDSRGVPGEWNKPQEIEVALFPPQLQDPAEGAVIGSEEADGETIRFAWTPVEGALKYRIEIRRGSGRAPIAVETTQPFAESRLPAGDSYSWTVLGFGPTVAGEASKPASLRVALLTEPATHVVLDFKQAHYLRLAAGTLSADYSGSAPSLSSTYLYSRSQLFPTVSAGTWIKAGFPLGLMATWQREFSQSETAAAYAQTFGVYAAFRLRLGRDTQTRFHAGLRTREIPDVLNLSGVPSPRLDSTGGPSFRTTFLQRIWKKWVLEAQGELTVPRASSGARLTSWQLGAALLYPLSSSFSGCAGFIYQSHRLSGALNDISITSRGFQLGLELSF